MYVALNSEELAKPYAPTARDILRTCVHCGFCLATCPTYQLLGDERDSPRGRIYLIKGMLEGEAVTRLTQRHLDRCLTCRSCESTCPSGVRFATLLDLGREQLEQRLPRPRPERWKRWLLVNLLTRAWLFRALLKLGQLARPWVPARLRAAIPAPARAAGARPSASRHERRMILVEGCVQPGLAPNIDAAAARVLDRLGISLISTRRAGCCGALAHHLTDADRSAEAMRRNVDAWWPLLEQGAEALVLTASGCGAHVKEYGRLLCSDPVYAQRAQRIAERARDVSEVVLAEMEGSQEERRLLLRSLGLRDREANPPAEEGKYPPGGSLGLRVAFHSPCTLQHGQKLRGGVEAILRAAGAELTEVPEPYLCCGSAGTYSLLQLELSNQLRERKLAALQQGKPLQILSANIGCLTYLGAATPTPVLHWIEWLDQLLGGG